MDWIEVTVKTTSEGADTAAQIFYAVGIPGVVIEDPEEIRRAQAIDRTWDYIDDSLFLGMEEAVLVKAYLQDDAALLDKLQLLRDQFRDLAGQDFNIDLGSLEMTCATIQEADWANHWKRYYKPIQVSDHLVIKPSWEDYTPVGQEQVLTLDPGMAFGTGTHETTILCIRALDAQIRPGDSLLDIGCGTGVLSIAGLLLGAERADAVDIDANAVRVARENAVMNQVEARMSVIHGDLLDKIRGSYDLITANIIADVILALLPEIHRYMKPGGRFIASGIILDRLEAVTEAAKAAGYCIEQETLGEWAAVVMTRHA